MLRGLGEVDGISRFIKAEVMQSLRVIYAQGCFEMPDWQLKNSDSSAVN